MSASSARGRGRRGNLMVISILLSAILLIMGMCFLTIKVMQYRGSTMACDSAVAAALADAGIEDARIKMAKDPAVLTPASTDQTVVAWAETVYDLDGITPLGVYEVTLDVSKRNPPYSVVIVTSEGIAGPPASPLARRVLGGELDVSPLVRGSTTLVNAKYFRFINWTDSGAS